MSNFEVERSNLIKSQVEDVYAMVRDFKSWPKWSPWLYSESDCALNFSPDGREFSWDGEVVGAGSMKVASEQENEFIEYELTLTRPMKSVSTVRFQFGREGDRTRTTWLMNGSLPFYLFWMKGILVSGVGMNYKRGLAMLKDLMQQGKVSSQIDLLGEGPVSSFSYVGVKTTCRIADIAEKMENDLSRVQKWIQDQHITPIGAPLSVYHRWSITQGQVTYSLAYPVEKIPGWLPGDFVSGKIPDCQAQRIQHTGSYRHLGNAWAVGMARIRAKIWKASKATPPFEIYENNPFEVNEDEVVTTVVFPSK